MRVERGESREESRERVERESRESREKSRERVERESREEIEREEIEREEIEREEIERNEIERNEIERVEKTEERRYGLNVNKSLSSHTQKCTNKMKTWITNQNQL